MREPRRVLPILLISLAIVTGGLLYLGVTTQSNRGVLYFDETEAVITEPFLSFYQANGEMTTFGLPLSDAYTRDDGTLMQPFEHVVLQQTVRGIQPVTIAPQLGLGQAEDAPVASAFTERYVALGGAEFFGRSLGPARTEGQTFVQDFETARLVQLPSGEVTLADLGEAYISVFPPPASYGNANIRLRGTPGSNATLNADISVAKPTIGIDDEQTIYVLVTEDDGTPIQGAQVLAVLHYGNVEAEVQMPATSSDGTSQATFVTPPATPGSQVIVEVNVLYGDVFFTVQSSYIQWW